MVSRRLFLTAPLAGLLHAGSEVRILYDGSVFRVAGWSAGPAHLKDSGALLAVYAGDGPGLPPMLGTYSVEGGVLRFKPRFPLGPDVRARAVFHAPGSPPVEARFDPAPRETNPITRVAQVYPSAGILPANLLKFYVEFTAPMARGEAWRRIRLLDANNAPVDLAFLEIDQELWDPEGRRLTVLFDPGRIKRGVLPREEMGSGLVEGSWYTLAIDREWRDANGAPLQGEYTKRFRVAPEARAGIDLRQWKLRTPSSGTSDPLRVEFPTPLDYALSLRMIGIQHVGRSLSGSARLGREEREWQFLPERPWEAGEYAVQVDTALEDLAGNRVGRPFDVDTFEPITVKRSRTTEAIPFRLQ